ncbi:RnfH family protein [Acidovorax sp.]|uniref:RnfH family protein n=1 Tax=Acidovorax sp. TaxID=1872122 RepID=UPI0025C5E73A|nr:RnfH family protein [Acidovorax sp.]MBL7090332.1 RnfH family protein [Acidovorax sp.]
MAEVGGGASATIAITVVVCLAPREVREWVLDLPVGATVADALHASCGMAALCASEAGAAPPVGIWGRAAKLDVVLQPLDRVEIYRPLKVDPKVARRERFARQGARTTGLFARRRPGGKSGY